MPPLPRVLPRNTAMFNPVVNPVARGDLTTSQHLTIAHGTQQRGTTGQGEGLASVTLPARTVVSTGRPGAGTSLHQLDRLLETVTSGRLQERQSVSVL